MYRKSLLFSFALFGTLGLGAFAHAESVPGSVGNYSGTPSGSSGLGFNGQTSNGTIRRVKQKFSVLQNATVSQLNLPIWQQGTPSGSLTVKLCSAAGDTLSDPCVQVLEQASYTLTSLPTSRGAAFVSPTELPLDNGFTLYPGVTYVIVLERTADADTNLTRVAFTAGDVYTLGSAWNDLKTCSNGWYRTESTASSCSGTEWSGYDIFFGFETTGGSLTLNVNKVGETAYASGECVEPADLPPGWQLFSNSVSLTWTDTSSTGTWLLQTIPCSGGFYSSSSDPIHLWNAAWLVEAVQDGDPQRFTASATFTMEGSSFPNPSELFLPETCPGVGFLGENLDNALPCYLRAFTGTFKSVPPLEWWYQIAGVFAATNTVPLEVTFDIPGNASSTWTLYSSATDTGLVHELESMPDVLGMNWMELMEAGLWLTFGFYLLARANSFLHIV